ncbi:MAG TPA: hypothetical protein VLD84_01965 [Nitrososphaeraceae archaeon]|nr:hypothetical protein [Nitrososphaeraceae archaeon]
MNTNKRMSIAVIFLAAAIIFVSSTPMTKNAFAQTIGEEEEEVAQVSNTGSQNYENFLTCLSDAGGQSSYPAGNQIVNCLVESGYVQGSSSASASASNTEDSVDQNENAQTSVVDDQSDDQSNSDDQSDDQSNSDDQSDDQSNSDDQSDD